MSQNTRRVCLLHALALRSIVYASELPTVRSMSDGSARDDTGGARAEAISKLLRFRSSASIASALRAASTASKLALGPVAVDATGFGSVGVGAAALGPVGVGATALVSEAEDKLDRGPVAVGAAEVKSTDSAEI